MGIPTDMCSGFLYRKEVTYWWGGILFQFNLISVPLLLHFHNIYVFTVCGKSVSKKHTDACHNKSLVHAIGIFL